MDNNFQLSSAAVSDRGLSEKRPQNEDSFLELNQKGIFAVADGVGGAQAGDVASQMAMEILGEAFINLPESADAEDVMRVAIERANNAIYQMSNDLPQLATMATTVVALHLAGNIATIGHVGDSRLYRLDENGNLFCETQDHSVVAEEVRAGRMTPEQALNHPSRNIISRALGAESTVEVDLKTIMFEPNNAFLLCSDGITRHIPDFEIGELLKSTRDPVELCRQMKEICYERGAEDNLTAVIVRISPEIAGSYNGAGQPISEDSEEATVAAARPVFDALAEPEQPPQTFEEPVVNEAATSHVAPFVEPIASSGIMGSAPASNDFDVYAPEENTAEPQVAEPAPPSQPQSISPAPSEPAIYTSQTEASGAFGSILSSVALLVLGGIMGVAAYYFLAPPVAQPVVEPPPQVQEMKSGNIPLTGFEESRRIVDKNPKGYLDANAATPENAEDFYLIGRAQLLTGKYVEARRSFREAQNRLAQADPMNAKTLANEIAIGLAIVDAPGAFQLFSKEIETASASPDANSAPGANTNTAANVNVPAPQ